MLYRGPERRVSIRRSFVRRVSNIGNPIDVLALMQCRAGFHMEGTHKLFTNYDAAHSRIASTKSSSGFPWDIRYHDENFIYGWITELNWTSPRDFKAVKTKFAIPFAYRYAYAGDTLTTKNQIDSQHVLYSGCKFVREFNIGFVEHHFDGPYTQDVGGDVGIANVYRITYLWNGTSALGPYMKRETFSFVQGFGQVGWDTRDYNLTTKSFGLPTASSVFNMIRAGTASTIFPCTYNP